MDEADITSERAEIELRINMANSHKPAGPQPAGHCLECGPDVPLPAGQRWCDAECRDIFMRREQIKS
jgi:hypothetical protein